MANESSKVQAPALPIPPAGPLKKYLDDLNNILRLYFNRLDNALRNTMADSVPYADRVARGEVAGASVVNIFGFNSSIGTTFIAPWELANAGTQYVVPGSATTMSLVSTNAADTGISILVQGLDASYNQIQEVMTLNGTTPVTTTNSYLRINQMVQVNGIAVGNVSLTNGGVTYARITAGVGKSQMCQYTVPAGYSFYLNRIAAFSATASGASKYIMFRHRTTPSDGTTTEFDVAQATFTNELSFTRVAPVKYDEKTHIQFQTRSSSGTNEISISAEGYLVQN